MDTVYFWRIYNHVKEKFRNLLFDEFMWITKKNSLYERRYHEKKNRLIIISNGQACPSIVAKWQQKYFILNHISNKSLNFTFSFNPVIGYHTNGQKLLNSKVGTQRCVIKIFPKEILNFCFDFIRSLRIIMANHSFAE